LPLTFAARIAKKTKVRSMFWVGSDERSLHNIADLIDAAEYSLSFLKKGQFPPRHITWTPPSISLIAIWYELHACNHMILSCCLYVRNRHKIGWFVFLLFFIGQCSKPTRTRNTQFGRWNCSIVIVSIESPHHQY
jgi:hypothetical protein